MMTPMMPTMSAEIRMPAQKVTGPKENSSRRGISVAAV